MAIYRPYTYNDGAGSTSAGGSYVNKNNSTSLISRIANGAKSLLSTGSNLISSLFGPSETQKIAAGVTKPLSAVDTSRHITPVTALQSSTSKGKSGGSSYGNLNSILYDNNSINSANSLWTDQMKFNHDEAQLTRDWQEYMSNTAHQREVADLKAAGLNPILSANAGAAGYSGASASASDGYDMAKLNAALQLKLAEIGANSAQTVAGIGAGATMYAANQAAAAAKYGSDNSFRASVYSSDTHLKGQAMSAFANALPF